MDTNKKRIIDLTVGELEELFVNAVKMSLTDLTRLRQGVKSKQFYSPKEFSHLSGIPYSTVVYRCNVGKLKARQDDSGCSWQICASELERFILEAKENLI